jgi:integrase
MILSGLYTGQRLGDIATLRWNNLDLARGELRLPTRKTGKGNSPATGGFSSRQIEFLWTSSNEPSAPIDPKAFDLVERQRKKGTSAINSQSCSLLRGWDKRRTTKARAKVEPKGETSSHCHFTA